MIIFGMNHRRQASLPHRHPRHVTGEIEMPIRVMDSDYRKADFLLSPLSIVAQQIALAIAEERERCAKLAESYQKLSRDFSVARKIADEIRKAE
jgi:hypothetical protein